MKTETEDLLRSVGSIAATTVADLADWRIANDGDPNLDFRAEISARIAHLRDNGAASAADAVGEYYDLSTYEEKRRWLEAQRRLRHGHSVAAPPAWLFIIGADDPEMSAIETLLREHGQLVTYAVQPDGERVTGRTAYAASLTSEIREALAGPGTVVFVECTMPLRDVTGCAEVVEVDHHRPGDPGYGKPPAEYWQASSVGQICALLAQEQYGRISRLAFEGKGDSPEASAARDAAARLAYGGKGLRMVAAADHCLAAAYAGQCPGVDPAALAEWRAGQIARFKKIERADVLRRVAAMRAQLEYAATLAAQPCYDNGSGGWCETHGCPLPHAMLPGVADLRAAKTDDGQILAEAGCQAGIAYLASVAERDGRRKVVLGGAGEGTTAGRAPVEAFLAGWADAQGMTGLYGDPARGFAGGYVS